MKSFEELEHKYSRALVQLGDPAAAGFLTLARDKTEVVLSRAGTFDVKTDGNGWLELEISESAGRTILLHNALSFGVSTYAGPAGRTSELRLFPNVVIFNAKGLGPGHTLSYISFRLGQLSKFFHYNLIEHFNSDALTPEAKGHFLQARHKNLAESPFRPMDVYLIHHAPRFFKFFLHDKYYEVWAGGTRGGGSSEQLRVSIEPTCTITFRAPTSINDAIASMWEAKRFFEQLAMRRLSITVISGGWGRLGRNPVDIYLPTAKKESSRMGYPFHPANMPYRSWKDRRAFASMMRNWLERQTERRQFRVLLGRVIEEIEDSASPDLVVQLCGAIENLPGLGTSPGVSGEEIKVMAEAAYRAATERNVDVSLNRLNGALSTLSKPGFVGRLHALLDGMSHIVRDREARVSLAEKIKLFRGIGAHGQSFRDEIFPHLVPTLEAFACLCSLYDFETCGASLASQPSVARFMLSQAMDDLKRASAKAVSAPI